MQRLLILTVTFTLCMAWGAFAATDQPAGAVELNLLNSILTGNIGFSLGLVVAVMGVVTMARGSSKGGITLIVLGVLITLTPSVYNSAYSLFCPAVEALSSGAASCH